MPPTLLLLLGAVGAGAPADAPPDQPAAECASPDGRAIIVCGQRPQPYRIDRNVMEAGRESSSNARSASSPMPAAQATCSASPMGCGKGLEGLDLANVAIVAGTTAVRAARGEDWSKAFKVGGPDEYQLYREAKRLREAAEAARAAANVRMKARAAERDARTATATSE